MVAYHLHRAFERVVDTGDGARRARGDGLSRGGACFANFCSNLGDLLGDSARE